MSKYHGPPSRIAMYQRNMDWQGLGMYFVRECDLLRPFFATIERHLQPKKSRLLEFGYGPGVMAIYLSRTGYKVTTIDGDPEIIALAKYVSNTLGGTAEYQVCDMFEIDKQFGHNSFDAVISDVTLEHFDDEDIVDALKKQLLVAKLNIFAVHCANVAPELIPYLDGGERLLKPSRWKDLIGRAGGKLIDRFGYGFQAGGFGRLNWRLPIIAEGIFYKRLAGFAACTGFVVTRRII